MPGYVAAPEPAGPPPFMLHGPGFPGPGFHEMAMAHMGHMGRAEAIAHLLIGVILLLAAWFVFTRLKIFVGSASADQQRYIAPIYVVVVLVLFLGGLLHFASARNWAGAFSTAPQLMIEERHMGPGAGPWRPPVGEPSSKP